MQTEMNRLICPVELSIYWWSPLQITCPGDRAMILFIPPSKRSWLSLIASGAGGGHIDPQVKLGWSFLSTSGSRYLVPTTNALSLTVNIWLTRYLVTWDLALKWAILKRSVSRFPIQPWILFWEYLGGKNVNNVGTAAQHYFTLMWS